MSARQMARLQAAASAATDDGSQSDHDESDADNEVAPVRKTFNAFAVRCELIVGGERAVRLYGRTAGSLLRALGAVAHQFRFHLGATCCSYSTQMTTKMTFHPAAMKTKRHHRLPQSQHAPPHPPLQREVAAARGPERRRRRSRRRRTTSSRARTVNATWTLRVQ